MKTYIASLLLASGISVSCSDFLTMGPEHSLTMDNSVTSYAEAQNVVNGIYGVYKYCNNLGGSMYGGLHTMAGLWDYGEEFYNMSYTQSNGKPATINSAWDNLYDCINAANAAIEGVSKLADSEYPSIEAKNALLAEARCFRGYCNLELLWLFGHWFDKADSPYGIIYRDKSAELSNLMVDRSTVGESYQYILNDLKFAEEHLGDYESPRYMSKQFAQAMQAKLLLVRGWDDDYNEALRLVNLLLTDAPDAFQMETDVTQLYTNAWDSKEVLFSRYLGDISNCTYNEYAYSYELFYSNKATDIPQAWLEEDERYEHIIGKVRSPETWDTTTKDSVLTKLYHRGRYDGPDDKYATYAFRYAELYIMKAELLARTNPSDIQGALKPLNDMRARYANPVMSAITGVDTYDELMDAIFKEYVVTLFMENESPWFAATRIEHEGRPWIYTLKPDVNFSQNQYCWPIPDDEIKAHSNKIDQNPGLE